MIRAIFLSSILLALCLSLTSAQNYEFCYTLQGGSGSSNGGYAVWAHGYFYTSGTTSPITITNTAITRNVINAVGQRHTEQLSGIVPTNNRVDQFLFLTPSAGSGYVDGSGIQLPVNGTLDPVNGVGTLLGYDSSQPANLVTAYGQTSQLNANINLLYTGTQYGERLDAGGNTIAVGSSYFQLQTYNPSTPITNCSLTVYMPLCVNYPATPPSGSVVFTINLNTAWSTIPATYLGDLFAALTVLLAPTNTQAPFLGFYLFSCYPTFSRTSGSQPQIWFYMNSQSAAAMGMSISSAVSTVYSALQPGSTAANNAYLPTAEQGLIASTACPQLFSGGQFTSYTGVTGCGSASTPGSSSSSSTSAPTPTSQPAATSQPATQPSSSSAGTTVVTPTNNSSGGSSGLSHGAIAGIVIGSVVGALLLLFVLIFLMRCVSTSGDKQSRVVEQPVVAANHKRFENENSQVSTANTDGVELA